MAFPAGFSGGLALGTPTGFFWGVAPGHSLRSFPGVGVPGIAGCHGRTDGPTTCGKIRKQTVVYSTILVGMFPLILGILIGEYYTPYLPIKDCKYNGDHPKILGDILNLSQGHANAKQTKTENTARLALVRVLRCQKKKRWSDRRPLRGPLQPCSQGTYSGGSFLFQPTHAYTTFLRALGRKGC